MRRPRFFGLTCLGYGDNGLQAALSSPPKRLFRFELPFPPQKLFFYRGHSLEMVVVPPHASSPLLIP